MASTSSLKVTYPHLSRLQKRSPVTDPKAISHSVLVDGAEHVVSYGGTSQYNRDGTGAAACGLAAMNFARIVFSIEHDGLQDELLLQTVLARECAEETTAICALWSGNLHLEVEDIYHVPLFEKTLKLKTTAYGLPGVSEFKGLLMELNNLESSAAVIITRPPEILTCLKLRLKTRNVFIIFDSHPRPSYPNGAGMTVSPSIEDTARRLTEIFPTVDLPDSSLQWQAQLLSNYSGHVFVPHGVDMSTPTLWQAVLESSVAQLSMQAEIADLRSQNEFLKNEQQRLESEIREAEVQIRHQKRQIQQLESSTSTHKPSSSSSSSKVSTSAIKPFSSISSLFTGSTSGRAHGRIDNPPTPPFDPQDGLLYAMRLQHEYNEEDRALSAQRIELEKSAPRLFECSICMEEIPEDSIARPDPCGHSFCRACLRGHVTARLDEHRFPILCPTCTADKGKGKGPTGNVPLSLALDLGLTDKQYAIWTDMEMVAFSVVISCQKCKRSMFVAKDEHEETLIIACPLPDCNHVWCKQCQQSIDFEGPKHSCDGTSELDHLMKEQGWKYCPTCKTPIQKESGCNHMSCMTPACNTHFCYVCGGLIVRSALGNDIKVAISNHYSKNCGLFTVPD
ncbi:hypothetical protein F5148DRAFT_1010122 [Russula earlei]|uniref:Uncharacterized protein n=1 Tax=Russula earlei TaxID=71964 RepID=A0ACC0UH92_9AGAM|nr:hypothetical protein F5148DRAFT_1010122 [Russula earlei]